MFRGPEAADAALLTDASEQALIRLLAAFPAEIAAAAEKYDPARITPLRHRPGDRLPPLLQRLPHPGRRRPGPAGAQLRCAWPVRGVIHNVLTMFKINAPESM